MFKRPKLLWLVVALVASTGPDGIPAASMPQGRDFVNSLGMKFVRIAPGTFLMGSAEGGDFDERPVHRVTVSQPFYLGVTEVTNAQYERFDASHRALRGKLGFSKADDEAVVFVDWRQAVAFCRWLSAQEGLPYRLPTEAEWEYACRAGTATAYHTGPRLDHPAFLKNVGRYDIPPPVSLAVGRTPPNAWGLYDMHGNVEEWCLDWYGPYEPGDQVDPVGRADGDFRVTRGGSHSTTLEYLRSANRSGTLPEDKSWLIGFRVAIGPTPSGKPLPPVEPPLCQRPTASKPGPAPQPVDPAKPYFVGPRVYVKIPPGSDGPLFSKHNHDPAIVECPNGDLLAVWYTCRTEAGRELGLAASRLRRGAAEWDPASPFWDAPDRNDHAPALWCEGRRIYHFCGLSAAATWGNLAVVLRISDDSGFTWSKARLIAPEHGRRHQPVESVFRTRDGTIVLACDAVPGGRGGTALLMSRDGGNTWFDPGEGKPQPEFRQGASGAWIAGIHAAVAELHDGRLLAFGRGDTIAGRMPQSVSADGGRTWSYSASPFPPIGGGQRAVLLRLAEGPLLFASFAATMDLPDASGKPRPVSGLFAALSLDEGRSWPIRKLITDGGPPRELDGGGNTGRFTLSRDSAEPRGYLSVCQDSQGVIHLISSKLHYAFNLAWLKEPQR